MCVSSAPADFKKTTLFLGLKHHPIHGTVFVLGYQNTAVNLHSGPNAMLLHLPGINMSQENFLDTNNARNILKDMVTALKGRGPQPLSMPQGIAKSVQVFEHDIYTVVLASDASQIPSALHLVPKNKRIKTNQPLFDFYARMFPGYAVSLCCFDNRAARRAAPLLVWYQPMDSNYLRLPALDCHSGNVPAIYDEVDVDHWVVLGSDDMPYGMGNEVVYTDRISPSLMAFLPDRVIGLPFMGEMPNGDFGISHADLLRGKLDRVARLLPPAVSAR